LFILLTSPIFQRYQAELDTSMRRVVGSQANQPHDLGLMLRYALGWVNEHDEPFNQPTGKRIRPFLLLLCAESAGDNWHTALPAAVAVEFLHNFSLIHDDIQDNSSLRHNRSTLWKIWGTANAINAGDALFTMAYHALESLSTNIPFETAVKAWRIFNETALELTRGQHLDMQFEHQVSVTVDDYLSMIKGKSAALIAASAQLGGLIASKDFERSRHFSDFGINLGMAFQIRDDILGIWGDPAVTGKSIATDILSRKKSLPVIYGLSESDDLASLYQQEQFTEKDVGGVVSILNSVDALDYTERVESGFYHQAFSALEFAAPQGQVTEFLKQFVDSLLNRHF
jgi:geranylgeranyl diphosphate synthase, type I